MSSSVLSIDCGAAGFAGIVSMPATSLGESRVTHSPIIQISLAITLRPQARSLQLPRPPSKHILSPPHIHVPRPLAFELRRDDPFPYPPPPMTLRLDFRTRPIQHKNSRVFVHAANAILCFLAVLALPQHHWGNARLGKADFGFIVVHARLAQEVHEFLALLLQFGVRGGWRGGRSNAGAEVGREEQREEELRGEQDVPIPSREINPLIRRQKARSRMLDATIVRRIGDHEFFLLFDAGAGWCACCRGFLGRACRVQRQEVEVHLCREPLGDVGRCYPAREWDQGVCVGDRAPFVE